MPRRFYPLQLPFSYIALRRGRVFHKGWGETVEISSNQIRITPLGITQGMLTEMIMAVTWPAKLPDGTSLQLMIHVLPAPDGQPSGLFRILKHEFRTASREANGLGLTAGLRSWTPDDAPRLVAAASGM